MFILLLSLFASCLNTKDTLYVEHYVRSGEYMLLIKSDKGSSPSKYLTVYKNEELIEENQPIGQLPYQISKVNNDSIFIDHYLFSNSLNENGKYERLENHTSDDILKIYTKQNYFYSTTLSKTIYPDSVLFINDSILCFSKNSKIDSFNIDSVFCDNEKLFVPYFKDKKREVIIIIMNEKGFLCRKYYSYIEQQIRNGFSTASVYR